MKLSGVNHSFPMKSINRNINLTRSEKQNITSANQLEIDSFVVKFQRFVKEEEFKKDHLSEFSALTDREKQILELVAAGCNNPCISKRLHISRCTVEQHRKNINRKLQIKSVADVFEYALAFNLL